MDGVSIADIIVELNTAIFDEVYHRSLVHDNLLNPTLVSHSVK
jgi:hypothetical protein